jgi:glutaredoxin
MTYLFFKSEHCPKCEPVKEELLKKNVEFQEINVSTDDGLFESIKYNVMKTPTIVIKESGKQLSLSDFNE